MAFSLLSMEVSTYQFLLMFSTMVLKEDLENSLFQLLKALRHSILQTQQLILVQGVTLFENVQPLNPIVVNRGQDVNITAQLVESSNMFQPLDGFTVDVRFDETWLASNTTDPKEELALYTQFHLTNHWD